MPSPSLPNEYPIELNRPDISGACGGQYRYGYLWRFESGKPGPHVMISAIVHGNELCGALTLDWLLRDKPRPVRGTLSLGFMNVEAFHRYDPADPNASRFADEDFNRVWARDVLDGPRDSIELRRAREIRPYLDTVDLLLDIHSMQHPALP
ncbi:MAG: succinylglutamate desuccinylase/aspartoacylase family protein [Burkholderiaceae bacterium]